MEACRLRRSRSNWSRTILVCGKCSKKIGGGFGDDGRTPVAKALRKFLRLKKGRKAGAGIVETRCLGICPKGAVTVIDAAAPREWLIVPPQTDLTVLAQALGLTRPA